MEYSSIDIASLGITLFISAAGIFSLHSLWKKRFHKLHQQISRNAEDLLQMVEIQADGFRKFSCRLSELEERVFNLAFPSAESTLPFERRHQVMTLANKGMGTEEIARRLNVPRGEAELILNLRRFMNSTDAPAIESNRTRDGLRRPESARDFSAGSMNVPAPAVNPR